MFGKDFLSFLFFGGNSLSKHYAKRVIFKGIFNFLNKAILWLFWATVDTLFTFWVLKRASSWWPLSLLLQAPRSGHPHTEQGPCGQPSWGSGDNLELISICALPSNTLYGNSRLSSVMVWSYSDGCNGEWLVLFFHFVLLFDGRWDEILALSAPIQLKSILDSFSLPN